MFKKLVIVALGVMFLLSIKNMANAAIFQSGNLRIDSDSAEKVNPPVINSYPAPLSELLANPGFESGSLPPWYTEVWSVVTDSPHAGAYCAFDEGNNWIRQDFAGVAVADITSVTFWSRQPEEAISQVVLFYSDGTSSADIVWPTANWQQFDVTSWLTPGKTLTGIKIWGYVGGGALPDYTYIDDVSIQTIGQVESSVKIKQLWTEDGTTTWNTDFAPGDTITINEAIRINGDPAALYNMQVRYFFKDAAGNTSLLANQLYLNYSPGTYYVYLTTTVPAGAALGNGIIRNVVVLSDGVSIIDRSALVGFIEVE